MRLGPITATAIYSTLTFTLCLGCLMPTCARGADAAKPEDSFKIDVAALNTASPPAGTVINAANVDQYADILDENLAKLIRDGLFEITTRDSYSIDQHEAYVDATRRLGGTTSLGDEPGVLNNYQAGRPFPFEPDLNDPRAGEKIAWNLRYTYAIDGSELKQMRWQYRNMRTGKLERELAFYAAALRFQHRHVEAPLPMLPNNPAGIYNALYLYVESPPDLRNTQLLIHRMEDDTIRDHTWLYVASHRRVRRLASGQTTDAFLGSDIMIEDFIGYNGRVMDMKWSYLGTVNTMLPFHYHDELVLEDKARSEDGFKLATFNGKGNCFPNSPWQLRKAYILEAEPHWNLHPLSKRRYYVDAQTSVIVYANLYDQGKKLWKIGIPAFSHPDRHHPNNAGVGSAMIDLVSQIDVQAEHCTTIQFKVMANGKALKASDFTVQTLRVKGR